MRGNRVRLVLAIAGVAAAAVLPFLSHAPNRLLSGQPVSLAMMPWRASALLLLPGAVLLLVAFFPRWPSSSPRGGEGRGEGTSPQALRSPQHPLTLPPLRPRPLPLPGGERGRSALIAVVAGFFVIALVAAAGLGAAALAAGAPPAARTSLGSGFWGLLFCAALLLADALRVLALPVWAGALVGLAILAVTGGLAASGALDQLSLAREYANRRDVFAAAIGRHVEIVLLALAPTLALGLPLGLLAHRRARWRGRLFAVLNIVQTIPSIALFALLIAPLAGLGLGGVGLAPAVVALVLYSLLPVVRSTVEGLAGVPADAIDAARGIGMTPAQRLVRVELPLAAPVLLAGIRITTVQAIGLAAVAALIGAGGLGALMFQGLFANALDLVLLGALPIVLLALAADAGFRVAADWAERRPT
jgi:osmoprotectant transport system permease protein